MDAQKNFGRMMRSKRHSNAAADGGRNKDGSNDGGAVTATTPSPSIRTARLISDRLEAGLNEYTLQAVTELLERGESPDAVVAAITSLSQHHKR
jgi:hypothetical protein